MDRPYPRRLTFQSGAFALTVPAGKHRRAASALLTGKLFDAAGEVMSPTVSRGRNGRVYRYYVSASLQQGATRNEEGMVQRLPAPAIDRLVTNTLSRWLPKNVDPSSKLKAIHLVSDGMQITLASDQVASVTPYLDDKEAILRATGAATIVQLAVALPLRGGQRLIVSGSSANPQPDATLINALRRAHAMVRYERRNPVVDRAPASPYERRLLRLAFLTPDIQRDILTGHQPATLNLEKIMKLDLAASWPEQRNMLGWQSRKRSCSGE